MKKENGYTLVAITWGLLIFLCAGPVFADFGRGSTIVRERTSLDGSTYISDWCFGDIENQAGDGVLVTTVPVELVNFVGARHRWSVDIDWINANISAGLTDIYVKVSAADTATGYLDDKITVGTGVITTTIIGGGGDEDLDLDVAVDGIDDTRIDWGIGANQVDSEDVPNDTTNFDGNLSGTDTNVLIALETIDEMPIGSGLLTYYLEATPSDIVGYREMAPTYASDLARNSAAAIIADATLIEEWITPLGQPNLTALTTGVYSMHLHAQQTGGTKTCTIYFELYKRAAAGAEVLLATSEETPDVAGASTPYTIHANVIEQALLATDRIVIKMFGNEGGAGTDPVAQIDYQALTLTRFEFPAQASALLPCTLDEAYDNGDTIDYSSGNGSVQFLFPNGGATDPIAESLSGANRLVRNQWIQAGDGGDTSVSSLYYTSIGEDDLGDYHLYGVASIDDGVTNIERWTITSQGLFEGSGFQVNNYPTSTNPVHQIRQNTVIFNGQNSAVDFQVYSVNHDNAILVDASEDIISVVGEEFYVGDADTQTDMLLGDGTANFFSDVYPPSAIDAGWERPNDIPGAGEFLKVEGVVGNVASLEYAADNNTHVSQFVGYISGAGLPGDAYINMDLAGTTAFAGTGVNDIVGYGLPWNISIVGISANYQLDDFSGVTTIDIYPREDGANINAACKLTLIETGLNRDSVSDTFVAGTYTVVADQTLGIYIDTTTTGVPLLTDLIVTVYYHYSL